MDTSEGNDNFLSLSRPNPTLHGELIAFSCKTKTQVWRERMDFVIELGGKPPPPGDELNQAIVAALVGRVVEATDLGTQQALADQK